MSAPGDPSAADAGAAAAGGERALSGDWPAAAADAVVDLVQAVRERTIGPLLKAVRGAVYGLVIAAAALMALLLLVIALIRFIDSYLPGEVWSAYVLLGGVFTLVGAVLWSKRQPTT